MAQEPAAPPSPRAGDIIAGKYHLERPIGLGAMGLVFEATHVRLGQRVAIKFMQSKFVGQSEAVARFEREGRAASRLTSPHAARIIDVDTTPEGVPYIVSELLEGRDLRHELDERGKLPIEEATTYVIEACAAMAEAHSLGIVHRDLKPSNLFLARTGGGRVVKVVDFGISKMEEELELTTTGIMLGSPRYMSPEQVEAKRVDRRADIWALGVILYRAISGSHPFEGTTSISLAVAILTQPPRDLLRLAPDVPRELVNAIGKALAHDLAVRHATARAFAEALAPFASPAAATLARSLTWEAPVSVPSKPRLEASTPDSDTLTAGKADVDALIEVSLEPPEQATRGTWAQPSIRKDADRARSSPRVLGIAGLVLAVALLGFGVFAFARYGTTARVQASASVEGGPAGEGAGSSLPVSSSGSSPQAAAPPTVSASLSASETVAAPSPSPPARTTRPPAGSSGRPAARGTVTTPASPPPIPSPKNPTYL